MLRLSSATLLLASSLCVLPASMVNRRPPVVVLHATLGFSFYGQDLTAFNQMTVSNQQAYVALIWNQIEVLFTHGQDGSITVPTMTSPTQAEVKIALDTWLGTIATDPNMDWVADPPIARGEWQDGNVRKHRYSFVLSDGGDQSGKAVLRGKAVGKQLLLAVRRCLQGAADEKSASLLFHLQGNAALPTLLVHADLSTAIPEGGVR